MRYNGGLLNLPTAVQSLRQLGLFNHSHVFSKVSKMHRALFLRKILLELRFFAKIAKSSFFLRCDQLGLSGERQA
jgi:hypothetical protein